VKELIKREIKEVERSKSGDDEKGDESMFEDIKALKHKWSREEKIKYKIVQLKNKLD